jgi:hypothetical protein
LIAVGIVLLLLWPGLIELLRWRTLSLLACLILRTIALNATALVMPEVLLVIWRLRAPNLGVPGRTRSCQRS